MQSEKDALIERYASDAFKNRNNQDLPVGVWRQHFVEFADKLAVLSTDAEPVFWYRPRLDGLYEGPHHASSVGGKMLREEKPSEWLPLYAAPPAPSVAVKDLEWSDKLKRGDREGFVCSSSGVLSYSIMLSRFRVYGIPGEHDGAAEFTSLAEAKAAAQADYESRIRSALVGGLE